MIHTLDYGILPIAKNTTFINNFIYGLVETCDNKFYEVRRAFSGSLVAVEV
jgi:hypothetical protein